MYKHTHARMCTERERERERESAAVPAGACVQSTEDSYTLQSTEEKEYHISTCTT